MPEPKKVDWTNPAAVLRAAAADMVYYSKHKDFEINMDFWITPYGAYPKRRACEICLAGSLMVGQGFMKWGDELHFLGDSFSCDHLRAFSALNSFRQGDVFGFISNFENYEDMHISGGNHFKPYQGILTTSEIEGLRRRCVGWANKFEAYKKGQMDAQSGH